MKLVYFLQLAYLLGLFAYGYRNSLSAYRTILVAVVSQAFYLGLLYVLYSPEIGMLDVFDILSLDKELWLPNLIKWLGSKLGNHVSFHFDRLYFTLFLAGGTLVSLLTILAGAMFHNAVRTKRYRSA